MESLPVDHKDKVEGLKEEEVILRRDKDVKEKVELGKNGKSENITKFPQVNTEIKSDDLSIEQLLLQAQDNLLETSTPKRTNFRKDLDLDLLKTELDLKEKDEELSKDEKPVETKNPSMDEDKACVLDTKIDKSLEASVSESLSQEIAEAHSLEVPISAELKPSKPVLEDVLKHNGPSAKPEVSSNTKKETQDILEKSVVGDFGEQTDSLKSDAKAQMEPSFQVKPLIEEEDTQIREENLNDKETLIEKNEVSIEASDEVNENPEVSSVVKPIVEPIETETAKASETVDPVPKTNDMEDVKAAKQEETIEKMDDKVVELTKPLVQDSGSLELQTEHIDLKEDPSQAKVVKPIDETPNSTEPQTNPVSLQNETTEVENVEEGVDITNLITEEAKSQPKDLVEENLVLDDAVKTKLEAEVSSLPELKAKEMESEVDSTQGEETKPVPEVSISEKAESKISDLEDVNANVENPVEFVDGLEPKCEVSNQNEIVDSKKVFDNDKKADPIAKTYNVTEPDANPISSQSDKTEGGIVEVVGDITEADIEATNLKSTGLAEEKPVLDDAVKTKLEAEVSSLPELKAKEMESEVDSTQGEEINPVPEVSISEKAESKISDLEDVNANVEKPVEFVDGLEPKCEVSNQNEIIDSKEVFDNDKKADPIVKAYNSTEPEADLTGSQGAKTEGEIGEVVSDITETDIEESKLKTTGSVEDKTVLDIAVKTNLESEVSSLSELKAEEMGSEADNTQVEEINPVPETSSTEKTEPNVVDLDDSKTDVEPAAAISEEIEPKPEVASEIELSLSKEIVDESITKESGEKVDTLKLTDVTVPEIKPFALDQTLPKETEAAEVDPVADQANSSSVLPTEVKIVLAQPTEPTAETSSLASTLEESKISDQPTLQTEFLTTKLDSNIVTEEREDASDFKTNLDEKVTEEIVIPEVHQPQTTTTPAVPCENVEDPKEKEPAPVTPDPKLNETKITEMNSLAQPEPTTSQLDKGQPEEIQSKDQLEVSKDEFDDLGLTEQEALQFLKEEKLEKKNNKPEYPFIQLYGSSVSGNMKIKKAQSRMINALDRFKVKYEFVDLAADDEAKKYIKRKNPTSTNIPQLYVDGEFKMEYEEFDELLEYDELLDELGVDYDF